MGILINTSLHIYVTGYVSEIQKLLFSMPVETMSSVMARYNAKLSEPLNRQLPKRLSRDEAIEHQKGRKRARTELIRSAKLFLRLHVSLSITGYMCLYNKANPF